MSRPKPTSGDTRALVKWLAAGQPRKYADSEYTFILILDQVGHQDGKWKPRNLNDDLVQKIARVVAKEWVDKDDPKHNWASPTLKAFSKIEEGQWRFHIVAAYTG